MGSHTSTPGPFTIFAPTNRAFDELPEEVRNSLMRNMTLLQAVMEYHVVRGKLLSQGLNNEQLLPTLQANRVRINIYKPEVVSYTVTFTFSS